MQGAIQGARIAYARWALSPFEGRRRPPHEGVAETRYIESVDRLVTLCAFNSNGESLT
jgi:hypothetical protein